MNEPKYQIVFDKEDLVEVDGYYYVTDPVKIDDSTWQQEIAWKDCNEQEAGN